MIQAHTTYIFPYLILDLEETTFVLFLFFLGFV